MNPPYLRSRLLIAGVIFLFCLGLPAFDAGKPKEAYLHRAWTMADGLPQSTVYCLLQARDGTIWIGTDAGLAQFDGSRFRTFQYWNTRGFTVSPITSLAETADGSIWIGTVGGGLIRYREGRFERWGEEQRFYSDSIWTLHTTADGVLWIGTLGNGVFRWQNEYIRPFGRASRLPNANIKAVLPDGRNGIWLGTEAGLVRLGLDDMKIFRAQEGLTQPHVFALALDQDQCLWVGTAKGLFRMRKGEDRLTLILDTSGLLIRSLLLLADGDLLIGSDAGLFRIHDRMFTTTEGNDLLNDNSLLSLMTDATGNLWVGTTGNGLNLLADSPVRMIGEKEGLARSYAKGIYQDSSGSIWIGTNSSGVTRFAGESLLSPRRISVLANASVQAFAEDRLGNLWIGTDSGLFRHKTGQIERWERMPASGSRSILSLFTDAAGALWVGMKGAGLARIDKGIWASLPESPAGGKGTIYSIVGDQARAVWMGTSRNGLLKFTETGGWQVFGRRDGIPGDEIYALFWDDREALWIGTSAGLAWFRNGRIHASPGLDAYGIQNIYRIMKDDWGNIWCSSNRGIFALPESAVETLLRGGDTPFEVWEVSERKGMGSSVCTGGFAAAGFRDRQGKLWFPTMKGVAVIDPLQFASCNADYPLRIGTLEIDENPANLSRMWGSELRLPQREHRLRVYFHLPEFLQPERIHCYARLEGAEKDWRPVGSERTLTYTLPERGRYRVLIRAVCGGRTVSQVQTPFIVIRRSFWRSPFFPGLIGILLTAMIMTAFDILRRRRRNAKYGAAKIPIHRVPGYRDRLLQMMNVEKPYLDLDLTVAGLAEKLGLSAKHLSQLINEQFALNFNDFINRFRVEEAVRILQDPKLRDCKLLKVAFDSGFNSKSVFNEAFKKFTGKSPSAFRSECRDTDS